MSLNHFFTLMNDSLLSAIKAHDFTAIRNICFALSEQERNDLIHTLQTARWEQLYHNTDKRAPRLQSLDIVCFSYIFLCVSRSSDSLKKAVKGCYSSDKDIVAEFLQFYFPPLLDLLTTKEGRYLTTSLQSLRKNQFLQDTTFQNLWTLYQKGFIAFDEDLFIEKFFFWNNKHITDEPFVNFLLENKEISEKIFSIVPQHITQEVPYPSDAWKELYHILQAKGYFADRSIVGSHIEALLNPYKKNILDFYCRIIETFEPTRQELLSHQSTFFALLSSDKTSVVNFVMKLIKEISSEKDFDFQAFAHNFALCFATQKIAKSQLIGLDILAKHYKQQPPVNIEYREQLAVLFTIPDAKLQEKVATLLTTYFNNEGLCEVIAPYHDYLKPSALQLLPTFKLSDASDSSESPEPSNSPESPNQSNAHPQKIAYAARPLEPNTYPLTPEKLLFLIGDCIRERSPLVLDLFFEGLNQLQAQIPADFSQQISPYQKQLGNQPFEFTTYRKCMRWVIDVWEGKASLSDDIFGGKLYNPTPFLREKTKRLLLKLKQGNTLPFVSTPTHRPFYIDPQVYLERIAQYEKAGKTPMWEDVIVGLNRLLPTEITEAQKQLALSLTGEYAPALQYYFEVSNAIAVTDATRVLWGQVLRLKDIDGVFPELEIPQKPNLQGLVRPFYLEYEVKPTKIKGLERNKIILEDDWDKKYSTYSLYNDLGANYYNVSPMSKATDEDIDYQLSLNPRYIDGWLCKYLLTYAQGMEGESLTEATRVMSLLLEYHLPIYHGGWLMVATCLLAERKNLRDLTTEYILLALQRGETLTYLAEAIGTLLAHKYAPIARFIEFLDLPTRNPKIKAFQKSVVEAYLPLAEKQDKKPTNHKKLVAFME